MPAGTAPAAPVFGVQLPGGVQSEGGVAKQLPAEKAGSAYGAGLTVTSPAAVTVTS